MINLSSLYPWFKIDMLNGFVVWAIILFSVLTLVYSFAFMKGKSRLPQYYSCIALTAIVSVAAVISNNLILLAVFWGFLGLTLFLLINIADNAEVVAKKSLIIIGGTDALMLLGIAIIYSITGTFQMDNIRLEFNNGMVTLAYICIAVACFAKAGAIPFHSWIPDCAKNAPLPVTAFLPAALDKLLGIYLLSRMSLGLFVMNKSLNTLLMFVGAFTIIAAVMMALVQHNLKRLLGYHAVSQVGYMVLGIGTGNPIGIAGGLFHMLNNAIYKSCLFFSAGNVEFRAKSSELDELGGLGKLMPLTYMFCLVASLSISGIPPFNGFVSKWLIYQGLILCISDSVSRPQTISAVFCLIAAMFGSVLTLASFIKLLHAVFLGQRLNVWQGKGIREVPRAMWIPCLILASLCVLFGVFAFNIPLKYFIFPAISLYQPIGTSSLLGSWVPIMATLLVIIALVIGFIIFKLGNFKLNMRRDTAFTGGETVEPKQEDMVTGTEFYNTVREMGILPAIYKKAEEGAFDIYEQSKKLLLLSKRLQILHNGVLPTYLVWMLLGMVGLFFVLLS